MDAEKVIVELLVKSEQFDRQANQSATAFDASMNKIAASATKAETAVARSSDARIAAIRKESAQISQASKLLGTQLNDIGHLLNGPNSPFVVPQKQAPAVNRAMLLVSSGAAALGGVIGGVLTAAVISYVASLAEMILKQKDASEEINDLVEKLQEQARQAKLTEAAQDAFGYTIEGVTKALDDQEKALRKLEDADRSAAHQAAVSAEVQRLKAIKIREVTVALLEQARAEALSARQQTFGAAGGAGAGAAQAIYLNRVGEIEEALKKANTQLERAEHLSRETLAVAVAERASEDELARIRREYDAKVQSATKRILADGQKRKLTEQQINREIFKQTELLREQQRVAGEAARKRNQAAKPDREIGGSLTAEQARSIVNAQFGAGAVTSGRRSAAHNKDVGGVPNSFHLTGNAIDVAKRPGVTLNKITELLRRQGVTIAEALDEGDHYHVAWRNARSEAERLAQAQARAALEAERREQSYLNEKGGLDQQVIDGRQALITSAEELAKLELEAIEKARVQYNEKLASLVEQNKISGGTKGLLAEEAAELQKLNDERAKLRAELVKRREDERKFRLQEAEAQRKLQNATADIETERELLQSRADLATTAKQRHDLEQRLIQLAFNEERLALQATIAGAERLRIELERLQTLRDLSDEEKAALQRAQDQAKVAQDRLGTLGERQANAQAGNDQANAGPLASFFGNIPDTATEINEALESIAAGGLATFTDALTDAIVNWRGFGDVAVQTLRSVAAGIIRLGIQQLLLRTIGQTLGSAVAATTGSQMAAIATAAGPAASLVSLATLGANAVPAQAAIASTAALAAAIGASGFAGAAGFESGGYTGNSPTNKPAGVVHGQEFVFDAAATRRIGVANLEAMRAGVRPSNAAAVAPGGSGGAGGLSREAAAELRGIVETAIAAMPPVQLFPTYDPVRSLKAALDSPDGRRVMLDFNGQNRGAVGGVLS